MASTTGGARAKGVLPPSPAYLRRIREFPLRPLCAETEHEVALNIYRGLLMANEKGKLSDDEVAYMRILGNIIDKYEEEHFLQELGPEPGGREVLEFLMEQHGLRQVDLRDEIGTQSVVSEVLSGRRWLTLDQIHKLAKRFRISPALLLNE